MNGSWAALLKRHAPTIAGELLLTGFFVFEPRLRTDDAARSLEAGEIDQGTTRDVATATVTAALGAPAGLLLRRGSLSSACGWAGVGLMASGIALRVSSARTLGGSYTRTLRVRDEQTITDTGAYRWIRHPGYAGMLLAWAGYGLAWMSAPSVAATTVPTFAAYVRRIGVEERMLARQFGGGYERYRSRTARMVPGVW